MKKTTQFRKNASNRIKKAHSEGVVGSNRNLLQPLKLAALLIGLFFSYSNPMYAQTDGAFSKTDLKSKLIRKELRQEKESTKEVENISGRTYSQFEQDFPQAQNIGWSVLAGFPEVSFTIGHNQEMAYYDNNNQLIGSGKYLKFSDIPKQAQERIEKDYKGYIPSTVIFFDDNENNVNNMPLLGIPIEQDSYFILLKKGKTSIVIQALENGEISYFNKVEG